MQFSQLTVTVIFIFLPGILALIISERLTTHPERKGYELFAYAFVVGCAAHLIYSLISKSLGLPDDHWLDLVTSDQSKVQGAVALHTALIGAILGLMVAFCANHSFLHRFARIFRITRKFADFDVWSYLMNSDQVYWIVVRNQTTDLMYQGKVITFSTNEDPRELVLSDVTVFQNSTAAKLYDTPLIYLSFDKKNAILEVQRIES